MEKPKLEKLIKKLETLDIREWKYNNGILTAEVCGMRFRIYSGKNYYTRLLIKNMEGNIEFEDKVFFNDKETKGLKVALELLYNKTYESLLEYEDKQLTERLDTFLLE